MIVFKLPNPATPRVAATLTLAGKSFIASIAVPSNIVVGFDISQYALENAHDEILDRVMMGNAKVLPFVDKVFKLVFCKDTLHNILQREEVVQAISEIMRVSSAHKYIRVGAYSNQKEKDLLDKWAVVATTYVHKNEWLKIFKESGYDGDYSWFLP